MLCESCGRSAKAGARFCGSCGASLAPRCPACGAECEPDLRFCEACGTEVGARTAARPAGDAAARKVVSIVFADLVGSTALHERLDAEAVRQFMEGYYAAMRGAVEAHGGRVTQVMGDGVKAVFGAPRVAEDDAIRAVRAGVAMQRAFRELAEQQRGRVGETGLRVAVNTGEVVADDASEIIGDPVNVAARLQQEARDGDVLIGEATQRLVASLVTLARFGTFALKGRSEPVAAWRVVSLERPAGAAATPFVGREEELARLGAAYRAATSAPAARLAVLLGSPGLGKSRLLAEFARQLEGRARVLTAQCSPAVGATFAPLAEALRAHFQLETGEALRAALDDLVAGAAAERSAIAIGMDALLAGTPALPEEIFFVVRRILSALAAEQPVVLVIDDLQWAEPLLLDFTEHLVQWGAGVPLLVLGAARPELRETRSSFTTPGGLVSDVVTLAGLDGGAAMRLAAGVIGADTLPAAVAGRVLATSEGNPLFLGELVRMLVNDGILERQGERWTLTVDLAALEMPPTIQALLAARIERLGPEERLVLERAAVVGRRFSRASVTHLLPREAHADLDARLEALRRSELVEADAGWLLGEPALRFHHVLIRDAAYRRVLRGTRAELHARLADWLEARAGGSVEQQERIGWHLEQAHGNLRELGPLDANGRALGARAARLLGAAGQRALARDDLGPAADLLGRALECLGEDEPTRGELALDWCEALLAAGAVGSAERALAELGRFSADSQRLRAWYTCFTGQLAALADPKALRASADAVAQAAQVLAAAGDLAGEAKAHQVHADALGRLGMIGACEAALDKALAAARRAGDRRRANAVLAGAPIAALWGPSPVTRASGRCLDVVRVLRITQGAPAVEAVALRCQGVLETLRGRSEAAHRMIASSRRLVEELGITQRLLEVDHSAGLIELFEGDALAAERWLRPAYEGFRAHGLGVAAAQTAALLGQALLAQGHVDEAEALSRESEDLAGDDFQAAIDWRGTRALALAGRGEHAPALELARAAVEIASGTDDLLDHAAARSALAVVLRAAGRSAEADAEEARAIELWEQKGATLLVERARGALGRVPVAPPGPAQPAPLRAPTRRRVASNAATAAIERLNAAIAARDEGLLATLFVDGFVHLHHATSLQWDRSGFIETTRRLWRAEDLAYGLETLATIGGSLALVRQSVSASGTPWRQASIGPYEFEEIMLAEVDADAREWRGESFASDHLGDAIARLYERHAELLPEGTERTLAAANARLVAIWDSPVDPDRDVAVLAPTVEVVDHRTLGSYSGRGMDAFLAHELGWSAVAEGATRRAEAVLALRADALLARWIHSGTDRTSGGAYERPFLLLWTLGADGLATHWEFFDLEREDDALARFDALTTEPPVVRPVRRRLRPNAALANLRAVEVAFASIDFDALEQLVAADATSLDHSTGAELERAQMFRSWRSSLGARDFRLAYEPLATLGDTLVLSRSSRSASGVARGSVDVGAYVSESLHLSEVDAQGRRRRAESFPARRLGDAVVRLYELHAERLADGPEKTHAAGVARSVAVVLGPYDLDRYASVHAPAIAYFDHRVPGVGSLTGVPAVRQWFGSLLEIAEDVVNRYDDVLALGPEALLLRWTNSGTERIGGGRFERHFLWLAVFGPDGLVTRIELFDADRDAEALARFDALTVAAVPPIVRRRVHLNAATAQAARFDAALAARDADALPMLLAEDAEVIDHTNHTSHGRSGTLDQYRRVLRTEGLVHRQEPLATLGDSLALCRLSVSGSRAAGGTWDIGAFEYDQVAVVDVDASGRRRRLEIFPADHLGDAVARLYERHAELLPEGPERALAAANARLVAIWDGPLDADRHAAALAPSVAFVDHRTLGTFASAQGPEALGVQLRSWSAVADDVSRRAEAVLALRADALLARWTHSGVDRTSGGPYELAFLLLWTLGADGLATHWETFDPDRDAEALARFDELTAAPALPAHPPLRRVRPNAATVVQARIDAAIAAQDADAIPTLFSDEAGATDHTLHTTWDRQAVLSAWRALALAEGPSSRSEALATLGDSLALFRVSLTASRLARGEFDVGGYEKAELHLTDVDAQGRRRWTEVFAREKLGDAVARLYERHGELLPEGPERFRALATARSVGLLDRIDDPERWATTLAPDVEFVDRRALGLLPPASGPESLLRMLRSLHEVARDPALRVDDVLALDADAHLLRLTNSGSDRVGGGRFERELLVLRAFGSEGLVTRYEFFDRGQSADALARFDALAAGPPDERFANAAWRALRRFERCWGERDWDGVLATYDPAHRMDDRRKLMRLQVSGEAFFANERMLFEETASRWQSELLATRGDRLALARVHFTAEADGSGPMAVEMLDLVEVDAAGRRIALVVFDADDPDAAWAELDARFDASGSGAWGLRPLLGALAARDWAQIAQQVAPDIVWSDHRRLGLHEIRSREEYLASLRAWLDLVPDARVRTDHVLAQDGSRSLAVAGWVGTREGGPFEIQFVVVVVPDAAGRIREYHTYDLDQLDLARARYAELGDAPPTAWVANAATRNLDRAQAAFDAHDWDRLVACFAREFHGRDRRRAMLLELDREQQLEFHRTVFELGGSRISHEVLATRGDRLALARVLVEGSEPDAGPSEIESLIVLEVNERGERIAVVRFDLDDREAAHAELDERYGAEKPPILLVRRINARDWSGVAALAAPDLIVEDHRRLGWETLHGSEAYVASLQALVELAPDASFRLEHLEVSARGAFGTAMLSGTREGGAFEDVRVLVVELDSQGRGRRLEFHDLDRLDAARARYEALATSAPPDPLAVLVRPNAASEAMDRGHAALAARDEAAVCAMVAEGARFEDRRRQVLLSGDAEWFAGYVTGPPLHVTLGDYQRTLVATAGDHVCLERVLWTRGPADGRVEIEYLWLAEVDEGGRFVAGVMFDVDDRRAAQREVLARVIARDPVVAAAVGPIRELLESYHENDRTRLRAVLSDDVVLEDRRRTGIGRIEGVEAYLERFDALAALARDVRIELLSQPAIERHGAVATARGVGTLAQGGGSFEVLFSAVVTAAGGRITRIEQFEVDQLDVALARLAELRPDPLRIPPNAATRATDRYERCMAAGDWDALRALYAPTMVFDDRRRLVRTMGDREMFVANCRLIGRSGTRLSRTLLATAGDRLALEHFLWTGAHHGGDFEAEHLMLAEVDSHGRCVAAINFDADDRRAASRELLERWERGAAARGLPLGGRLASRRAVLDRDLDALRSALPEGYLFHDHRRTGAGRIEGAEGYVAWIATLLEASRDAILEALYYVAVEPHAFLSVSHSFGTLADGGAFESVFVALAGAAFSELFELDDLELARARFEALRPDPLRIPPNAATRVAERIRELHAARDWEGLRALAALDFRFDDRQKRALVTGDVELWIRNREFVSHSGETTRQLIGSAGDRVAIQHVAFAGDSEGGAFEAELLVLTETDADGRLRARISFDADDRAAAFTEAQARFAAGEAAAVDGQARIAAFLLAIKRHDWQALRGCLTEEFVIWDRRPLSVLGTLDREQWLDSWRALAELAPDLDAEVMRIFAWNDLGRVQLARLFGTRDGGAFEIPVVNVLLVERDRIERLELFDAADIDRALARFSQLCAER